MNYNSYKLFLNTNERVRVKDSSPVMNGMLVEVMVCIPTPAFDDYIVCPIAGNAGPMVISEIFLEKCLQIQDQQKIDTSQFNSIEEMNDYEKKILIEVITFCNGDLSKAAKKLGIGRATLYRKNKEHNITPSKFRKPQS